MVLSWEFLDADDQPRFEAMPDSLNGGDRIPSRAVRHLQLDVSWPWCGDG
jgi:hypothetical protein